ncbi:DUF6702 family protein [Tenacibaculum sp. 190524A05c]|uniref:DUF6702 family protein n=1 Tax=Tenacibaculum platacis TaxID=3137852 RepID=UPI0031FB4E24
MRQKLSIAFLFLVVLSLTSFTHPLKATSSLIAFNADSKTIKVECKVFVDDFLTSLGRDMNVNRLTKKDKSVIEKYFDKNYIIKVNGKKNPLKFDSSEYSESFNLLTITFQESNLNLKKGDKLLVTNTLLFDEFGFLQSNRMELRFPPFFKEAYFESTKVKDSFIHTF